MESILLVSSFITILLFASTAISKISNWDKHLSNVREYMPFAAGWVTTCAGWLTLIVDLGSVVSVLLPALQIANLLLPVGILLLYTAALIMRLLQSNGNSNQASCACGGLAGDHQIGYSLVLRNLIYMIVIVLPVISGTLRFTENPIYNLGNILNSAAACLTALATLLTVNMVYATVETQAKIKDTTLHH